MLVNRSTSNDTVDVNVPEDEEKTNDNEEVADR